MITAVIPFLYKKNRKYLGKNNKINALHLSLNSLINSKLIKEILFIDASLDNSNIISKEALKIQKQNEKLKVIKVKPQEIMNLSWMLNVGIKNSTQPYFMRHDIDSIISPKFDELYLNVKKEADVIHQNLIGHQKLSTNYCSEDYYHCTNFINICKYEYSKWYKYCKSMNWNRFNFSEFLRKLLVHHPFIKVRMLSSHIICKKEKIEEIGGYDESFRSWGYQDDDLRYRLELNGNTHLDAENVPVIHQPHTNKTDIFPEDSFFNFRNRVILDYNMINEISHVNNGIFAEDSPNTNINQSNKLSDIFNNYYLESFLDLKHKNLNNVWIDFLKYVYKKNGNKVPLIDNKCNSYYRFIKKEFLDGIENKVNFDEFCKNTILFFQNKQVLDKGDILQKYLSNTFYKLSYLEIYYKILKLLFSNSSI
ncbi:MAG: galactosyltransferase-related protein [Bacillota bacterium]